jgi:NAD(P)-dependent dehydrogenase (short-subunit alcohol dehydrogenase family)
VSRTALVTGGARGIGQGIAIALARAGFDIAILSRETPAEAQTVIEGVKSLGRRSLYVQHDISQIAAFPKLIERIDAELGSIDCLVNNAGVTSLRRGDLLEVAADSFDRSVAVNLRGTFFLTQAVARHMIATPVRDPQSRYRAIVTITSANAEIIGPDRADYCMTKAALAMMSKLFAARLASERIHVFELRPGIIRTEMTLPAAEKYDRLIDAGGVPIARWGTPDDIGTTVATIAEGRLPFSTGEVINVGGGLHLRCL